MHRDTRLLALPDGLSDAVLLLSRLLLGIPLMAHGWDKLVTKGTEATGQAFSGMGIPLPQVSGVMAGLIELVGGAMLVLGLLTPLAGLAIALNMAGAWWFVHRGNGVLSSGGGWELVGAIAAGALLLAAVGPGRLSLDALIAPRVHRRGTLEGDGATRADRL